MKQKLLILWLIISVSWHSISCNSTTNADKFLGSWYDIKHRQKIDIVKDGNTYLFQRFFYNGSWKEEIGKNPIKYRDGAFETSASGIIAMSGDGNKIYCQGGEYTKNADESEFYNTNNSNASNIVMDVRDKFIGKWKSNDERMFIFYKTGNEYFWKGGMLIDKNWVLEPKEHILKVKDNNVTFFGTDSVPLSNEDKRFEYGGVEYLKQ